MSIIFLVVATTITKDSTKKLDKKIFEIKESIRIHEDRYEFVLLDYNILTSPKQLIEYQKIYFEDDFIQKKIESLNWVEIKDGYFQIENLNNNE